MKNIYILGAAGSIGRQTLDLVKTFPNQFHLIGVSLSRDDQKNIEILDAFPVEIACLRDTSIINDYQLRYPNVRFVQGDDGLVELVKHKTQGVVINALSGSSGLYPTVEAIKSKKDILLANKETLVMAGDLIQSLIKAYGVSLYPIDSEHNALWQLLMHEELSDIEKIIITASGGSLRYLNRKALKDVTVERALQHPNWSMGAKITIDSATMMNKGLEVIEAHHLFNLPYEKIETILHDESLVHGFVSFKDGSLKALLSPADMRMPILYALSYPKRAKQKLSSFSLTDLHFKPMDFNRFPLLKLAYEVGKIGGLLPTVMNAANEAAVNLFLKGKITFLQIEAIVMDTVHAYANVTNPTLDQIIQADQNVQKEITERYLKESSCLY